MKPYIKSLTIYKSILCSLTLIVFSNCSSKYTHTINFDRTFPLRVAVVPFYQQDSNGNFGIGEGSIALDQVPFISEESKESPTAFLRNLVQHQIAETALDPLSPRLIDTNIAHAGLTKPGSLEVDLKKLANTPASEICSKILPCDAVLYGKVTNWSRDYYGIQSVNAVGLEVSLISAKTGQVLFQAKGYDVESSGLSKGPTGFSDLIVAPISGLDSKVISQLAQQMVSNMFLPLKMPDQKELEENTPPAIFAATHDILTPQMKRDQVMTVLLFGTPSGIASFSLGDTIQDIPMVERSLGHYVGEFHPSPADHLSQAAVTVQLHDKLGRAATQIIGRGEVSLP